MVRCVFAVRVTIVASWALLGLPHCTALAVVDTHYAPQSCGPQDPHGVCDDVALLSLAPQRAQRHRLQPETAALAATAAAQPATKPGVNLGGWLHLEDWFFSGPGANEVASSADQPQGGCLPPLVPGLDTPWPSEGILVRRLSDSLGAKGAADAFEAHRRSYVSDEDFERIASVGINVVRVPVHWAAFADALAPIDQKTYGAHNPGNETVVVPDPYYTSSHSLVTVPRDWLKAQLLRGAKRGLRFLLDMHALPGGSADGTFNGVFPAAPVFFTANVNASEFGEEAGKVPLADAGLLIAEAMVKWVESFSDEERTAVAGITMMNEPAHMTGVWRKNAPNKVFAEEDTTLGWLAASADRFRGSSLPGSGLKLYVNLIETAFVNFTASAVPWFHATFSAAERSSWVVADVHWYTAWSAGACDGLLVAGGAYLCDAPVEEVRQVLRKCVGNFATIFSSEWFPDSLRATSQFSLSTFHQARKACNQGSLLRAFLEEQLEGFAKAGIEGFFWTWHLPYGGVYQPGWSLKYHLGFEKAMQPQPCLPRFTIP